MNRLLLASVFVCLGAVGLNTVTIAQAESADEASALSGSASVAIVSDYMFRGQNLYDGVGIQPTVGIEYDTGMGVLGASTWMHISADQDTRVDKFFETDYTLSYAIDFDPLSFKIGHNWYTYPRDSDNIESTAEFFGVIGLDDGALGSPFPLNPTFGVYSDYDQYEGEYYELGLSTEVPLSFIGEGVSVSPYVNFGFAGYRAPLYSENGFVQTTVGMSTELPWGSLAFTPNVNYTFESDDTVRNEFWAGVSLGGSF